jgi:hypothetical protein
MRTCEFNITNIFRRKPAFRNADDATVIAYAEAMAWRQS